MFERFTDRARQVVVLAQDEARALGHDYIAGEHLLLGLLREDEGIAARVLESLDVTADEVREQVRQIVGQGPGVPTGQIPFKPDAVRALEGALREAVALGHNFIGTEHLLLGLVSERGGVTARILLDFDADPEKVRTELLRMLSGPSRGSPSGGSRDSAGRASDPSIERIRAEKEQALEEGDFERAANLRDLERGLRQSSSIDDRPGVDVGAQVDAAPFPLVLGWLLFAVGLAIGLLAAWLIWG